MTTKITKEKSNVSTIAWLVIALALGLIFGVSFMTLAFGYETVGPVDKHMACYTIDLTSIKMGYPFCLSYL